MHTNLLAIAEPTVSPKLSTRYAFVDTRDLLSIAEQSGFRITNAMAIKPRKKDPRSVQHLVRMRHVDATPINGVYPEVLLRNSHDGTSPVGLMTGLYRLVCSNGLIVCEADFGTHQLRHTASGAKAVTAALELAHAITVADRIPRFVGRSMTLAAQLAYAEKAAALLPTPINPEHLLTVRRPEDADPNLWTVYNRVQENLMRGGILTRHVGRRVGVTRQVKSLNKTLNLNTKLWALTEEWGA
jgi:hypothetical protein